jgi:tetratricopeptide (TPR) repeat protein
MRFGISLLALIFIIVLSSLVSAQSAERSFYKANDLYAEGRYDEAIEEYKGLLERGHESGNLYYNLGNSYFKTGRLGEAILYYERSMRLMPRDGDLESNYRHARSLVKGNIYTPSGAWLLKFVYNMFDQFTVNELTVLLSIIYGMIIVVLLIGVFFKVKRQVVITISVLTVIFGLALLSLSNKISLLDKEAIVTTESAEVKFEPFERATTHFTLYEGMRVKKILRKDGWFKIERLDGKIGWIKNTALEII